MHRNDLKALIIMFFAAAFYQTAFAQTERELAAPPRGDTLNITRSGVYRLVGDISANGGDGIVITASNVTLNLNGHAVETSAPGTGRGIVITGASGVQVKNGKVGSFNSNVMVIGSTNVNIEALQIVGQGLAPNNGPSEIGIQIVNSRSALVRDNNISSVNLGIFVRGGGSTGNRLFENVITGGPAAANNLLGICYNPAP
ncbi:MAG TPA: right-handed parallel beta-helix repeat-containing protein, partial [Pyrinomonadaceae bacterium]|nr:right-handed parallel beta-helix repeat-containing protein [Pyrinomonadaceae bacterium]